MVFVPVLDSAVIDPYAEIPTLSMIGDVKIIDHPANRPFDQYPRNVAIRALDYMRELGIADDMMIGPEYEFHIFDRVSYDVRPGTTMSCIHTRQTAWASGTEENNNGYQLAPGTGYHASLPMDIHNDLRSRMCLAMKNWGIEVKYHHHEVGSSGQMEIRPTNRFAKARPKLRQPLEKASAIRSPRVRVVEPVGV